MTPGVQRRGWPKRPPSLPEQQDPAQPPAPCGRVQCLKKPMDAGLAAQPLPGGTAHPHTHFGEADYAAGPGNRMGHRQRPPQRPPHARGALAQEHNPWHRGRTPDSGAPNGCFPLSPHLGRHQQSLHAAPRPASSIMPPLSPREDPGTGPGTRELPVEGTEVQACSCAPQPLVLLHSSAPASPPTAPCLLRSPRTGPFSLSCSFSSLCSSDTAAEAQLSLPLLGHYWGKKHVGHALGCLGVHHQENSTASLPSWPCCSPFSTDNDSSAHSHGCRSAKWPLKRSRFLTTPSFPKHKPGRAPGFNQGARAWRRTLAGTGDAACPCRPRRASTAPVLTYPEPAEAHCPGGQPQPRRAGPGSTRCRCRRALAFGSGW